MSVCVASVALALVRSARVRARLDRLGWVASGRVHHIISEVLVFFFNLHKCVTSCKISKNQLFVKSRGYSIHFCKAMKRLEDFENNFLVKMLIVIKRSGCIIN